MPMSKITAENRIYDSLFIIDLIFLLIRGIQAPILMTLPQDQAELQQIRGYLRKQDRPLRDFLLILLISYEEYASIGHARKAKCYNH